MGKKHKARLRRGTRTGSNKRVSLPSAPWDRGADGRANRRGLEEEDAIDATPDGDAPNPNRVKRWRRVDLLEHWHRQYLSDRSGALSAYITTRQFNAAEVLRNAFEATGRAPGWNDNDRVQSSPKPDQAVTIQIDRLSRFHAISRHIPQSDRPVLEWSVLNGRGPKRSGRAHDAHMRHLREALDRLATALGL